MESGLLPPSSSHEGTHPHSMQKPRGEQEQGTSKPPSQGSSLEARWGASPAAPAQEEGECSTIVNRGQAGNLGFCTHLQQDSSPPPSPTANAECFTEIPGPSRKAKHGQFSTETHFLY